MSLTEKRVTGAVQESVKETREEAVNKHFDEHAIAIAERQYFQEDDKNLSGLFRRVANWVAQPESDDKRSQYEQLFFDLMSTKRFCPGGRVLAGAATNHGNVLNCFVQDGSPNQEGSNDWVMTLATKLALVTKVGGGNGLCLDPIKSKQTYTGVSGKLYITVAAHHADYAKVKSGTYMDLVHGKYITKGYRYAKFVEKDAVDAKTTIQMVGDSVEGIWKTAEDIVAELLKGQDVVLDLSDLRAEGTPVKGSGGNSSGPSSFAVEVFDNFAYWASLGGADYAGPVATLRYIFAPTLRVIRQGGTRRGAGMATMSIENSDIQDFITCKDLDREAAEGDISTFNISVLVGDDFMASNTGSSVTSASKTLAAIADHAWQTGEPGLIFIDRINQYSAMQASFGDIKATNPCGEIPLYPGEPCDLGAINLAAYVERPNEGLGGFAWESFSADVQTCIRFLDNVLEVNHFALEDNREMSMRLRRLGLGIMGLADALIKMGYRYDSEEGRDAVADMISELRNNAHVASKQLAKERGIFPDFDKSDLSEERRNVAVLTVAPTGTTSMLMGVSSGVEPIFAPFVYRKIGSDYVTLIAPLFKDLLESYPAHAEYQKDNEWDWDKIVEAVQENHGSVQGLDFIPDGVKTVLLCAHDISPEDHVRMQGVVQRTFDDGGHKLANSISKTINLPNEATVEDVYKAYKLAFETGCKGITVYRDGSRQFQVLSTTTKQDDESEEAVVAEHTVQTAQTINGASGITSGVTPMPSEPVFERPTRVEGFTDAVKLTDANGDKRGFYVTVNKQNDLPTEVFIISGKAGDEANADAEALGRLTSIALQYGVPAEAIIDTLKGINGGVYGSYQNRMVASKADLIAIALETSSDKVAAVKKPNKAGCPDCGSPMRFEEGCQKCEACGYSKCG